MQGLFLKCTAALRWRICSEFLHRKTDLTPGCNQRECVLLFCVGFLFQIIQTRNKMNPQSGRVSPPAFPLSYFFQYTSQCGEEGEFFSLPDSPVEQHRLEKGDRTPFWHTGLVHSGNFRQEWEQVNNCLLEWRDRCWFLHGFHTALYASHPNWMKVLGCAWQAGQPHSLKNLF